MKVRGKASIYISFPSTKRWPIGKVTKIPTRSKKVIDVTQSVHYKDLHDKLETRNGERDFYGLVRSYGILLTNQLVATHKTLKCTWYQTANNRA